MAATATSLMAEPIGLIKAQSMAANILSAKRHADTDVVCTSMTNEAKGRLNVDTHAPEFYIFTPTDGQGFVIISGDDAVAPILGWSDHSTFDVTAPLPPALSYYLDCCSDLIRKVRSVASLTAAPAATATPVVEPLCKSLWNQSSPYNLLCPNNNPVGCVATAMSQIMYYWQWPESGTGKMSYMSSAGLVRVTFSDSQYQWADMQASGNSGAAAKDAVSKLCYDCAVSVKMMFANDGSGSYASYACRALAKFFKYRASTTRLLFRNCVATDEEWNALVKAELDAARPMLYAASDANGGGGHAFVLDGYDSDFNVHVNWGWGGQYNGYFPLTTLNIRDMYEFSAGQQMVYGIEPDREGTDATVQPIPVYMLASVEPAETEVAVTDSFTIVGHQFLNISPAGNINVMVGLCDKSGNLIASIAEWKRHEDFTMLYGDGYSSYEFRVVLPEEYRADGQYVIRLFFQEQGFSQWQLPMTSGAQQLDWVNMDIRNGIAHFDNDVTAISQISADGYGYKGTVRHEGTVYNLSGQSVGSLAKGIYVVGGRKVLLK